MSIGTTIVASAERCLKLMPLLARDIPADQFARLAVGVNGPVQSNHPAFAYGHVSLYAAHLYKALGQDPSGVETPAGYAELFGKGQVCVDDPEGTRYPAKDEIMQHVVQGYEQAHALVASLDDDVFEQPPPEPARSSFATLGALTSFLLDGHGMYHLGQISAWRRMRGLGSVM